MAKRSKHWGYALSVRLDGLGYGSGTKLATALGRKPQIVTRWKDGEVPAAEHWDAIDEFFGQPGWTEAVVALGREMDELEMKGPSHEYDMASEALHGIASITPDVLPLPATDRARLEALEEAQRQHTAMLEELTLLVDSLADQLRELRGGS